jgi:hypothetical protein
LELHALRRIAYRFSSVLTFPKPTPCRTLRRRKKRKRMLAWKACRPFVLERDGHLCKRCERPVSDDLPEWHPARAHVNHMNGRRGDRLFDPDGCETLCRACHMPNGNHARRVH